MSVVDERFDGDKSLHSCKHGADGHEWIMI